MASRTSVYTNALNLPKWVMGGEFGDLSSIMNGRDIGYEQVSQAEQRTRANEYDLRNEEQQVAFEEELRRRAGETGFGTLKDAYASMVEAANATGNPEKATEILGKMDDLERQLQSDRRARMRDAITLAPNLQYGQLGEVFGDEVPIPKSVADQLYGSKRRGDGDGGSTKSGKTIVLYRADGTPEQVAKDQYNDYIQRGYIDPNLDERDSRQIRSEYERRMKQQATGAEDDNFFMPYARPSPSPTPTVSESKPKQDGKGDRARSQPAVGDQIKEIKRKRSV